MNAAEPTRREKLLLLAAAIPFLASLALAGLALGRGILPEFGIGWPIVQGLMYYGATRFARGEVDHPLVISQIVLHWMMLVIVIALWSKAL